MFQWLTELVSPHYDVDDLIEDFAPGHRARTRLDERYEAEDRARARNGNP
jgi:hypothetical protein